MRIFKTKWFDKWAKKQKLTDLLLIEAVYEINLGLIDAKLSEQVFKKRIGSKNRGIKVSKL